MAILLTTTHIHVLIVDPHFPNTPMVSLSARLWFLCYSPLYGPKTYSQMFGSKPVPNSGSTLLALSMIFMMWVFRSCFPNCSLVHCISMVIGSHHVLYHPSTWVPYSIHCLYMDWVWHPVLSEEISTLVNYAGKTENNTMKYGYATGEWRDWKYHQNPWFYFPDMKFGPDHEKILPNTPVASQFERLLTDITDFLRCRAISELFKVAPASRKESRVQSK